MSIVDYILASALWNSLEHFAILPSFDFFWFFFIKIKEMGHIKQKLRNSNNEKLSILLGGMMHQWVLWRS